MNIDLSLENAKDKWEVLRRIKDALVIKPGLTMKDVDELKPWGAYYTFVSGDKQAFLDLFYSDIDFEVPGTINPKYLVFEPGKKLSLQYHERREEIWKVIYGEVEAYYGPSDEVDEYKLYEVGDTLRYPVTMRHRGGATAKGWAIVAEIWRHEDHDNPSGEEDIIRISDDFGRV